MQFIVVDWFDESSPFPDDEVFELQISMNPEESRERDTYELRHFPRGGPSMSFGFVRVIDATSPDQHRPPRKFKTLRGFYSLGQSFTYYELMKNLPNNLGPKVLGALGDIVISSGKRQDAVLRNHLIQKLLGDSRAERALADAPQLFGPVHEPLKSELTGTWFARLPLGDGSVNLALHFGAHVEPQSRVVALVGDNGTGKSGLLASLVKVTTNPPRAFYGSEAISTVEGARVHISRVLCISYGAFDRHLSLTAADEADSQGSKVKVGVFYRGLQKTTRALDGSLSTYLKSFDDIEHEFREALREIRDPRRQIAFRHAIEVISEAAALPLGLVTALKSNDPERVSLQFLSSGQITVLNIIVSLVAYLEPGSLVVIDEPETHLHPPLLSALLGGIFASLESFSSYCVVATHSSVVAQELRKSNVIALSRFDQKTVAREPDIETFGESLGVLDRYIFGLSRSTPRYLESLQDLAQNRGETSLSDMQLSGQARAILQSMRARSGDE